MAVIATGRLRGTKGAIAPPSLAPTSSRRPSVASRMQENLLAAGAPPLDLCESLQRFSVRAYSASPDPMAGGEGQELHPALALRPRP